MQYFEFGFFFQIKQQNGRKPHGVYILGMSFADTGPEAHGGVKGGRKHAPEGQIHLCRGVQRTQIGELESKKK